MYLMDDREARYSHKIYVNVKKKKKNKLIIPRETKARKSIKIYI